MKYLLLLLPLTISAQERRLSVNLVTGIAGNYSEGYLQGKTYQTSWRMVQGYNGHDSMFGWDKLHWDLSQRNRDLSRFILNKSRIVSYMT